MEQAGTCLAVNIIFFSLKDYILMYVTLLEGLLMFLCTPSRDYITFSYFLFELSETDKAFYGASVLCQPNMVTR